MKKFLFAFSLLLIGLSLHAAEPCAPVVEPVLRPAQGIAEVAQAVRRGGSAEGQNQQERDETFKKNFSKLTGYGFEGYLERIPNKEQRGNLSDAELVAIRSYTEQAFRFLNKALREGGSEASKYRNFVEVLNSALSKLPNYTGEVGRGTSLPADALAEHQVGATLIYKAFTSTSTETGHDEIHRFIIRSKTGKRIAPFSVFSGEDEVLFRSGTRFRVVSRKEHTGKEGVVEFVLDEVE